MAQQAERDEDPRADPARDDDHSDQITLRRIEEYALTSEQIAQMPELAEEMERPMMLLVSAHKYGD